MDKVLFALNVFLAVLMLGYFLVDVTTGNYGFAMISGLLCVLNTYSAYNLLDNQSQAQTLLRKAKDG